MFGKILIANRGEIACRVIRTARRLGVATVALYSDADAKAQHVLQADEAVRIGPPAAAESYLRGERIIEAALRTGAEAIHPGYGFLSENPDFAEAVEQAGLAFIGPPASAIRAMGLKDAAKRLMEEAGVPVVPGYHGADQDPALLAAKAEEIGYPVLIKARAGGGGKGMRRVEKAADFASALAGARREAEAAFGDPACLVERWVSAPRHIEIQVFGDAHGNVVHLFERDCSLQRRHQKVIEEAPAPGMTDAMRHAMGQAAVRAAKAVGYRSAGTVEFIVDGSEGLRPDRFWFMEMNTRLQVEHPVTEAITGLDLVELQLRVAAGGPLPFSQADLGIQGHAFEARIYAEDPRNGFLPATGTLERLRLPASARSDSGVAEGDAITPFYDPLIAKLVVHGASRAEALQRLSAALAATEVSGTATNVEFLARLAGHDGFKAGEVDTGLIERDLDMLTAERPVPAEAYALAALEALGALSAPPDTADPWGGLRDFRSFGEAERTVLFTRNGEIETVRVASNGDKARCATPAGDVHLAILERGERPRVSIDGHASRVSAARHGERVTVFAKSAYEFSLHVPGGAAAADAGASDRVVSPMPGTVRFVGAGGGEEVAAGTALVVVEAMKMEHTLFAPRDGVVAEMLVAVGDQVEAGTLLLRLEAAE